MQKILNMTMSLRRLYSLAARPLFPPRKLFRCKGWACAGKGLLRELGLLRRGSQPEVLRVSNELCSAPWDNNESRAVLKINKLLELSIARLYREMPQSICLSFSSLLSLCYAAVSSCFTSRPPFEIRKSDTGCKYHLRPRGCHI